MVHHASKDNPRNPRGASALRAACSTVLILSGADDSMALRLDKYRHGPDGLVIAVRKHDGYVIDDDPTSDRAPRATPVLVEGRGAPVMADDDLLAILRDLNADTAEGAEVADVLAEVELYGMDRNALNRRVRNLRKANILRPQVKRGRLHLMGAPDHLDGLIT